MLQSVEEAGRLHAFGMEERLLEEDNLRTSNILAQVGLAQSSHIA